MKEYGHFIDGKWTAPVGGGFIEQENPFDGKPWARIARGTTEDVDRAVAAAAAAFENGPWADLTPSARGALLWRMGDAISANVERLARAEMSDNGRAITDVRGSTAYIGEWFRYFGGLVDKVEGAVLPIDKKDFFNFTRHEPYGVVAAVIAWNAPLILAVMKLAPGLAAGNTFVVKPSEFASTAVLELAAILHEAGLPAGVVNVVTGLGPESGEPLVTHPGVAKIAFTGGEGGGRAIYRAAADSFKHVTLELGGKAPNIVFADADLDKAAKGVVAGIFTTSGQACLAGSRLLVQKSIEAEFLDRLKEHTSKARLGDPSLPETEIGPIATRQQYRKVLSYLDEATAEGATCVIGGRPSTRPGTENGFFVEPTILSGVRNDMRVAREEIFGPVLSCIPFEDEAEAIRIANDTDYGLTAGVWTENIGRAIRMSEKLKAGTVWVNSYRAVSFMSPFGGYKKSGIGRENGIEAIREYQQTKCVWIGLHEQAPPPFGKPYG